MTDKPANRNVWKVVMRGSFFAFLIAFFAFIGLATYYLDTQESVQDATTGSISQLNSVNLLHSALLRILAVAAVASAVIVLALKLLVVRRQS
jgi:hypothetical protein